ncbi:MAG: hypothetical protein ACJAY8_001423, partial [Sphingobacteriales bacterium]
MAKIYLLLLLTVISLGFSSCNWRSNNDEPAIARAYDDFLYMADVKDELKRRPSGMDSAAFVQGEIKEWLNVQAIVHRARLNLPAEKQDFAKLVKEYENALFIYAYEKEIVDQRLEKELTTEEIKAFYEVHLAEFPLQRKALRLNYARFDRTTFKLSEIRRLFNRDSRDAREELVDYCSKFAKEYAIDDSTSWMYEDEVEKFIPISNSQLHRVLTNRWATYFYKDGNAYMVRFGDKMK